MSDFECPHCGKGYSIGDYPDHLSNMGPYNRFTFECECGATFACDVDWDPIITPLESTLALPKAEEA